MENQVLPRPEEMSVDQQANQLAGHLASTLKFRIWDAFRYAGDNKFRQQHLNVLMIKISRAVDEYFWSVGNETRH